MITDSKAQEILEAMKSGFQKVDHRFDKLEQTVGSLVEEVTAHGKTLTAQGQDLKELKQTVGSLEKRTGSLEQTISSLVVEVTSQGQTLKNLATRDEFNVFKDETLTHFDGLAGQIADLQEAETLRLTAH